jgi:hypothetical protein
MRKLHNKREKIRRNMNRVMVKNMRYKMKKESVERILKHIKNIKKWKSPKAPAALRKNKRTLRRVRREWRRMRNKNKKYNKLKKRSNDLRKKIEKRFKVFWNFRTKKWQKTRPDPFKKFPRKMQKWLKKVFKLQA